MIDLLWALAAAEVGLVGVLFTGLLVHAGWLRRRRRRDDLLRVAREQLGAAVRRGRVDPSDLEAFAPLDVDERLAVLTELARSLGGGARERVRELADSLGLLTVAARRCGSRSWRRRLAGARWFTALGGGQDVVPPLLDDDHPEVRAEAMRWVADHSSPELLDVLVAGLDDESRWCRLAAGTTLARVGDAAVPPLRDHLAAGPRRLDVALDTAVWVADPRLLEVAHRFVGHDDAAVRQRVVRLLAAIGGPEVVDALVAALDDEVPGVRGAAAAGLGRLGHWRAGGRLDELLGDPAGEVRRAAAGALRDLGDPGLVLLRRAAGSSRGEAADVARRMVQSRALRQRPGEGSS